MMRLFSRVVVLACGLSLASAPACAVQPPQGTQLHAPGNPILADGSEYSADPAPLVADGKLYIIAGRDTAAPNLNAFVMPGWQLFVSSDPASGEWTTTAMCCGPASLCRADKGQPTRPRSLQGPDGRYYLYAPVQQRDSPNADPFAIGGVAVADSPLGPWADAHPQGPVVSQSVPGRNDIQNIDPTVMVDDDGRVYLYWGTFGALYGVELQHDMVSFKGRPVLVDTLDGYFEAPWLFKRNGTYYLAYAANNAGRLSPCTPTLYHACIAYASAPTPLGPWTYRGIVLPPVSSTTSHPGIVEFQRQWYLVYHTADAQGGGHFRRSVAIDRLEWDDSTQPASIRTVVPTRRPMPPVPPKRNQAPSAYATASNGPISRCSTGSPRSTTASSKPIHCRRRCGAAGRRTIHRSNGCNTAGRNRSPWIARASCSGPTTLQVPTSAWRRQRAGIWSTGTLGDGSRCSRAMAMARASITMKRCRSRR
ncbi:family 43 glycosylhydrolase [Xanthomonas oryzae pv. oryzae]|nr:family 43 glycosylhydrolase [Xanthomonas oryzae pv. oryzae]